MTVRFDYSSAALRAAVMPALLAVGHDVRNEMLRLILRTTKSGRVYRRRGVEHQASAPGEPPASDLGDLVRSISPPTPHPDRLTVTITVSSAHARPLEYGTRHMAARPFARPAVANIAPKAKSKILASLKAARWGMGAQK